MNTMSPPSQDPISIQTQRPARPVCPRCSSEMILLGHLTDDMGRPVRFAAITSWSAADPMGSIRACYCNDCGEVTLTLE